MASSLKVLAVAGTRPEAIKLAPVIQALRARGRHTVRLGVSAQHRELLDQMLEVFDLEADFDLDLMKPGQDLFDVSSRILSGLREPLQAEQPDLVLVQGDTTTVFMAALSAFYLGIPVGHVEAGLRTGDAANPFPEEINRKLTTALAALHFAPSEHARERLRAEGVPDARIVVTGNTAVDAVLAIRAQARATDLEAWGLGALAPDARLVLITVHRRESFGQPLEEILGALGDLAGQFPGTTFVLPVHPNPNVKGPVETRLGGIANVRLVTPLPYPAFVALLERACLVLSDSGGVQEEGPALGTPVLVLRQVTERPEMIEAGGARLVGTERAGIVEVAAGLLGDPGQLEAMSGPRFPYGEGDAAERISDAIDAWADA